MNNNFKKLSKAINDSIDNYQQFIEALGKKEPKPRKEIKKSKIREFLFKRVL